MSIFNNKNFYPTPNHVIETMVAGYDIFDKVILEPHGGSGAIIDFLKENGAKEVLSCENDKDLVEIVKSKCKLVKQDFLKVKPEDVSHINMIIANPPFSNGDKHLLHMWNIAPSGCEIICLLNNKTLENNYTRTRDELKYIIKEHGNSVNLGCIFNAADRKTNVEVSLVKLYKPQSESNEFEGFFLDEEPQEAQENGIMKFDAIRDVVQRYIHSVKCFEEFEVVSEKMSGLVGIFGMGGFSFEVSHGDEVTSKDAFKKALQKKAWQYLFNLMNLDKYLTSGVMKDINKFVEKQLNVPFTMRNIYHMFDIIVGTREQVFQKALVEAIDNFTKHTKENRMSVEGWCTNSGHMLNKKFIVPYIVENGYSGKMEINYCQYLDNLNDLVKVLCSLTGKNHDDMISLDRLVRYRYFLYNGDKFLNKYESKDGEYHRNEYGWSNTIEEMMALQKLYLNKGVKSEIKEVVCEFGKWIDWGFFEVRGYKKGTAHLKFKDEKVWETVNRAYAKAKGQVLPEKFKFKEPKESKNKKETELIKY